MQKIRIAVAITALTLAGCRKPAVGITPQPGGAPGAGLATPALSTPAPAPVVVAAQPEAATAQPAAPALARLESPVLPEPAQPLPATAEPAIPEPPTPQPVAPAPELAPEGVFYLVSWVRIETNDGVIGLEPGTCVKLVRPGVYLTPAGEAALDAGQLTNNLGVARRVRDASVAAKAAAKQRQEDAKNRASAIAAAGGGPQGESPPNGQFREMDRSREAERQRLAAALSALERQEVDLAAQEAALSQTQSRGSAKGRPLGTGASSPQLSAALRSVRQQISETQAALNNLK